MNAPAEQANDDGGYADGHAEQNKQNVNINMNGVGNSVSPGSRFDRNGNAIIKVNR